MLFKKYLRGKSLETGKITVNDLHSSNHRESYIRCNSQKMLNVSSASFSTIAYSHMKSKPSIYDNISTSAMQKKNICAINELKKSHFNIRKCTQHQREQQKNELNNIHQKSLREHFTCNFGGFYLTETSNTGTSYGRFIQNYEGKLKVHNNSIDSDYKNFLLYHKPTSSGDISIPKLTLKINSILSPLKPNAQDFTSSCRKIAIAKHAMNAKKERIVRMNENYCNQMGELTEQMASLQENRKILSEVFDPVFEKYTKSLQSKWEKEKSELNHLKNMRQILEAELDKIKHDISRVQKIIDRCIMYRSFLICVKEKLPNLPHCLQLKLDEFKEAPIPGSIGSILKMRPLVSLRRRRSSLKFLRFSSRKDISRRESINSQVSVDTKDIERYEKYLDLTIPIFSSADSFMEQLEIYSQDNLKLLWDYNKKESVLSQMRKELEKTKEEINRSWESNMNQIKQREDELKQEKARYTNLWNKLDSIRGEIQENADVNIANTAHVSSSPQCPDSPSTCSKRIFKKSFRQSLHMTNIDLSMLRFNNFRKEIDSAGDTKVNLLYKKLSLVINNLFTINPILFQSTTQVAQSFTQPQQDQQASTIQPLLTACLQYLWYLEHILETLQAKHKFYLRSPEYKAKATTIENEIITSNKIQKAREQIRLIEERKEQIKKEIYEHSTEIVILPKRKVFMNYKRKKKIEKKKDNYDTKDEEIDPRDMM